MNKVNIAGVRFDILTIDSTCKLMESYIIKNRNSASVKPKCIQAANVDAVVKAHIHDDMKRIVNKFDITIADGMPIVWFSRLLGNPLKERIAGPDLFSRFNEIANKNSFSYYFLGSTEETLEKLIKRLKSEYPNIKILGYYAPPYSDMKDFEENKSICDKINKVKPDVVWVSFGCPKQERWIFDNKENIETSVLMGIGAAFDFYAGTIKRAPLFMQKIGLEWFYRFLQEPKRLWKRYFVEGPLFVKYVIKCNLQNKDV